jgi:hypothetical protein
MAWRAVFFVVAATASADLANDVVVLDGRVIDPEAGLDAIRNVAIESDKIVAISEFPLESDVVIDANDHIASSGFIAPQGRPCANLVGLNTEAGSAIFIPAFLPAICAGLARATPPLSMGREKGIPPPVTVFQNRTGQSPTSPHRKRNSI